ncbi:hypothetical protein [Kaarinaea lacus]
MVGGVDTNGNYVREVEYTKICDNGDNVAVYTNHIYVLGGVSDDQILNTV